MNKLPSSAAETTDRASQPRAPQAVSRNPPVGPERAASTDSSDTDLTAEAVAADVGVPTDIGIVFLGGLFVIATATVLYLAQAVFLPIVLAVILKLLCQPLMRPAERARVPRVIAALLITVLLVAALAGIFTAMSGPAGAWFSRLPQGMERIQDKFSFLAAPANLLRQLSATIDHLLSGTSGVAPGADTTHHYALPEALLAGTGALLSLSVSTLLLLFFLLANGDAFLRRLVEILPRFRDKRQAVDISLQVERDIGTYLVTVSAMNLIVATATTLGMYFCGLPDPILWGVIAFVLNYVPILGPITGFALLSLAGFMTFDAPITACMPALIYVGIHIAEGEIITPRLLAKRLTLNPALIVMSLIFWYWMWGVAGAFLAVPLLAITKIVCARIRPLTAFSHFLGS